MNIDALKRSLDCRTVARDLGVHTFTEHGKTFAKCYRGHDSKSGKSFTIGSDYYKCWNCGVGGDVITLIMDVKGIEFRDAFSFLAEQYAPHLIEKTETRKFVDCLDVFLKYTQSAMGKKCNRSETEPFLRNLSDRGFDLSIVDKYEFGYAHPLIAPKMLESHMTGDLIRSTVLSKGGTYHNAGRMIIPIRHLDRVVGYIGRYGEPKTLNNTRFPNDNFLFMLSDESRDVVVCEGDFDTLKVREAGFNACGLLGTHLSSARLKLLRKYDRIVLMLDNDEAGYTAIEKFFYLSYGNLDASRVYVAQYIKNDPCECTSEEIENGIGNAITIWNWMYRRNYEHFIEK